MIYKQYYCQFFNTSWTASNRAACHALDIIADTPPPFADGAYDKILYQAIYDYLYNLTARLLVKDWASLFLYVNIYVDYFIMIVQGGPDFHQRVCNNLFHCIYKFFRLYDPVYQYLQEPNHIKNILQGNGIWMEWKRILRWLQDTLSLTVPLPCKWLEKL